MADQIIWKYAGVIRVTRDGRVYLGDQDNRPLADALSKAIPSTSLKQVYVGEIQIELQPMRAD